MIQLNEDIKQLSCLLEDFLLKNGVNYNIAHYANLLLNILVLILIILGINYLIKRFVIQTFKTFTDKTKTTFDDFLIQSNFPRYVGQILPLMALYYLMPIIFVDYSAILAIFDKLFDLYVIILVVWICRSILRTSKASIPTIIRLPGTFYLS